MAELMDRPRLSESSSGPREQPVSANEGWVRSGGDIIKDYLGERNTPGDSLKPPAPGCEKPADALLRSDTDIIKEFLGERNLFSDATAGSGARSEQNAGGRATGAAPPRQAFSDSSWLDKFLDERDKELDCVLEDSDEEDEVAVSFETSGAADVSKVPRTHLIGRPTSVGEEELIARHKRNYETHCGIDYHDWTSVALQPSRQDEDAPAAADENVDSEAPGGSLSVEEILTDDFESSSACSSDDAAARR